MRSRNSLPVHPLTGLTALWVSPSGRAFYPIAGGDGRTTGNPVLNRLLDQRSEQETFIEQLLERVEDEERDLVDAERSNLNSARERITQLDEQIRPLEEWEETRAAHRARAPQPPAPQQPTNQRQQPARQRLTVEDRGTEYRTAGHFIVDLIRATGYPGEQVRPDQAAAQRVSAVLGRSVAEVIARAAEPNETTEETPGLLPQPIVGQILTDLDDSRPFVQSVGVLNLAGIPGKIFTRPHVTQHTKVGEQTAEKTDLATRQFKVEGLPFSKRSFGGWLNVSRQDIDWTSPSAWNALLLDLQNEYGADTDDISAGEFAEGVTQSTPLGAAVDAATIDQWIDALYKAAVISATADGTTKPRSLRLPNHVWTSIDMWASMGAAIDKVRSQNSESRKSGEASPTSFSGVIEDMERTMCAGFPAGTCIVGRDSLFEFYEERIGVLQAVEPRVLGVEVAYGGYAAWGFLDDTGFCNIAAGAEALNVTATREG